MMFVSKTKAESLFKRILLLFNRFKGYLNEVGRKPKVYSLSRTNWVKGYLNEAGRKQLIPPLGVKGYLNEVGRKPRTS